MYVMIVFFGQLNIFYFLSLTVNKFHKFNSH